MGELRSKWLTFYAEHIEPATKEMFGYVEKMIIGTLIVSAGAHVSSNEPAIVLFGYLRHGLVGRGVMLFGVILLVLNFLDGLYKLARLDWHVAYQIVMTFCYVALSVRLIQLILAFRGSRRSAMPADRRHAGAPDLLRGELGQDFLAGRRDRGCLRRQALHDAPTAGCNAAAQRANIAAACRPQHEQFLARPHRPQHQHGRRGGRGSRCRDCGAQRAGRRAPPLAALTACWQDAETFALFFSRHCSAGAPPVGTPAQTF